MNPNDIVLAVSENVDQIKYADTEKSWKVSDQITIDWRNVLPRPPNNSSEQTLKELQSKTHRTPAYPSGHTAYAAMGAHLLSARYPEYSGLFFRSVKVAAYARCLQGVHYPSDNAVAMAISAVIWEDIKYTTFLETETV